MINNIKKNNNTASKLVDTFLPDALYYKNFQSASPPLP